MQSKKKKPMLKKVRKKLQGVPDKKRYIDFIAAIFALPVMITVLIINVGNLQNRDKNDGTTPPAPQTIIVQTTPGAGNAQVATPQQGCKKQVGPIEIVSPGEGQKISTNPVNILIRYDDSEYCSVVWSYRMNGGQWSQYSSNSISIYNPPQGEITLDLRVQSTVSQDQTELRRKFEYTGRTIEEPQPTTITPLPSPTQTQ